MDKNNWQKERLIMHKHHNETINNVVKRFQKHDGILAVLIGGSIAHGFEGKDSDVDIMIVLSEKDYNERKESGKVHYFDKEDCTYEGGYIDGKYISLELLRKVAEKGSEPARFAFDGAIIAYSKIKGLDKLIKSISRYPKEGKNERIQRFYAQFMAWKWYCGEALKYENKYLLNLSVSNLILFGGRLILAHNEILYPYHKWFLRVLKEVKHKPYRMMSLINKLLKTQSKDDIEAFCKCITEFTDWDISEISWPALFVADSELNWLDGKTPIADI